MGTLADKPGAQAAASSTVAPLGAAPAVGRITRVMAAEDASPAAAAAPGVPAPAYVEHNRTLVLGAIAARIHQVGLAQPHTRLRWADPAAACAAVAAAIRSYADVANLTLKQLERLAVPAELIGVVDRARNGQPGTRWLPEVGQALGEALDVPLVASIQRMGLRLRVQLDGDAHGAMPRGSWLVATDPLDGVIADVLVTPGVVVNQPARAAADLGDKPFARGAREVEYDWMGQHDPNLWNWIRVTSPAHATAEDVARTPLAGGEVMAGSEQAYRIVASPPYFAIPIETAARIKRATDFAPAAVKAQLARGDLGPRVASGDALAASAVADDAALAQASGPTATSATSAHSTAAPVGARSLDHAQLQATYLAQRLAPWRAAAPIAAVTSFLQRRAAALGDAGAAAGTKPEVQRWTPVLIATEHTLRAAAEEAGPLLDELAKLPPQDPSAAAVLQVVRAYAQAAGEAHLGAQAPAALAEARRLRALLPIALAEGRIAAARAAVADQQATQRGNPVEARSREPIAAVPGLASRAADLRLRAARGEAVDADEADALAADADAVALRAEIAALQTQLAIVERQATMVGVTVANSAGWTIPKVTQLLRGEAAGWLGQLDRARDPHRSDGANDRRSHTAGARRTIDSVRRQKSGLIHNADLAGFLQYAYQRIADQELRTALNRMALQIGLMIATGEIAGAAVAAVRGVALAREARLAGEVIADVRELQLGYQVLETTSQAFLMTKAQGVTGGPTDAAAFAENLGGIALSTAAMKPFEALLGDARGVERELRTWLDSAGAAGRAVARGGLELGTGVVAAGAASTLVHGAQPHAAGADDLVTQGIALVASKLVHRHTGQLRDRVTRAMSGVDRAQAQALLQLAEALQARAEASSRAHPDDPHLLAAARGQLAESGELLAREAALYTRATGAAAAASSAGNAAARAARTGPLLEASLRLAGLAPVVAGAVFEGTPTQIADALADARRAGIPLEVHRDPQTGTWHVASGARRVELHEAGAGLGHAVAPSHFAAEETFQSPPLSKEDRAKLKLSRELHPETDGQQMTRKADVAATALGAPLHSEGRGHALLTRLAAGDRSALSDLGVRNVPEDFNSQRREFVLLETRDGYVVAIGAPDKVATPDGTRLCGHTHPEVAEIEGVEQPRQLVDGAGRLDGHVTMQEIVANPDLSMVRNSGLLPSPGDIAATGEGGYQVLHTRFVHVGDGRIANPSPSSTGPRINTEISNVRMLHSKSAQNTWYYEAQLTVVASEQVLWKGKVYTEYVQQYEANFSRLWFDPPLMVRRMLEAKP